ncbi:hypothetical protein VMT65_37470 [Nocardia sp. CDC153]|uniref:hypothetical protein n=1 Tax=Nocardia sp. CDC153 TaxID=3112167 RepID=UPI002DBC3C6D|nr:hypothetical protein [Nocardia sp. CDC153]MEC3958778.1 hypothetical protein [Nocardia sp. CDC153]
MPAPGGDQADSSTPPEWCLIATMRSYPYSPTGPKAKFRGHGRFPAGAKLYVIGGFAGTGYETVTVVGYGRHRRSPITVHLPAKYLRDWRVALVYRPAVLRAIRNAAPREPASVDRWNHDGWAVDSDEYRDHLTGIAAGFERWLSGSTEPSVSPDEAESDPAGLEFEEPVGFVRRWLRRLTRR